MTTDILGKETGPVRNTWFDSDCKKITTEKNEAYLKMQQKHGVRNAVLVYKEKRRAEKKLHRKKKREWEKRKLEELVNLHSTQETRKFYKEVNESRRGFKPRVTMCKAKDGTLLCEQDKILS